MSPNVRLTIGVFSQMFLFDCTVTDDVRSLLATLLSVKCVHPFSIKRPPCC